MGPWQIFRKNTAGGQSLQNLSLPKLKEFEFKVRRTRDRTVADIDEIDSQILSRFQKGKETKSRQEQMVIADEIRILNRKKQVKSGASAKLEEYLRVVSDLIIVKEHEADLKASGVGDFLREASVEQVDRLLAEIGAESQERETAKDDIKRATEGFMKRQAELDSKAESEEGLEDILRLMDDVKHGTLDPEAAQKSITKETPLKEE